MHENSENDPRGLIYESYRIEGIDDPQCRSIFLDWALDLKEGQDGVAAIKALLARYEAPHPEHPMTLILQEGVSKLAVTSGPKRTGRRRNG